MPLDLAAAILAAFLLAGTVKGVTGLGLPTVSLALLSLILPVPRAVALLLLPSLVANLWQAGYGGRFLALWARLWPMMLCICLGVAFAIAAGLHTHPRASMAILGVILCLYSLLGLTALRLRVPRAAERSLGPFVGLATGIISGVTGVFTIPAVPYLQALDLDRDALVQAMGISFAVSTVALGAGLTGDGAIAETDALLSLMALAPAMAGMYLGQRLRALIAPETFRRCLLASLLAVGVSLVVRSVI